VTDESGQPVADGDVAVASEPPSQAAASPPPSPSDAALERYRSRMRRSRIRYYAILAVVVLALGSWAAVTWSRGEAAHAFLHTFRAPPPALGLQSPSPTLTESWRTSDRIALGAPQYGGTVITYSTHTVGGRNIRTGARTWTYTRTDRVVCTAAQLSGTTVAVYANHGNCDEISAFASDTGQRRWTRTLDMDGMPLSGRPSYQVTPSIFLAATSSVIYAIDPGDGYGGWTYSRWGCRIEHVVLGTSGALISQNCSAQVRCAGLKFCGRGPQLFLRDGAAGRDDKKANADQIKWNRMGDTSTPVSADDVISSVGRHGQTLFVHDANTGARTHRLDLLEPATPGQPVSATATDTAEVIWVGGVVYALPPDSSTPLWNHVSPSPPVVASGFTENAVTLATARITVATAAGIGLLDGNDGSVQKDLPVSSPTQGALIYSAGTGFLVARSTGIVAYR
jgi:hypothetical protein